MHDFSDEDVSQEADVARRDIIGEAATEDAERTLTGGHELVSTASELGMRLPGDLRGRYVEDAYFKKIIRSPAQFPHFQYTDGLLYQKDGAVYRLCIPDILVGSRRLREILLRHAHSLLAHLGHKKTLELLRTEVWWP
ncbi:hypothetical protein K466DRAFT_505652, partial [Polyporus arcularius HHB13444]